jgi:lipoprotein-releasing system ATP-binding protein
MSNVLECRGLEKTFHDGSRELCVLRGIDLAVEEKEIIAISGASGAGKTTLLQIMGTLDKPTGGELLLRGEPLSSMGRAAVNTIRNQEIGFVFQFYHLLTEFTALENVMMPALSQGVSKRACRDRALELLESVGLSDRTTHKPGQLSGGEQQRVAIARALFNEPSIVLCDEPTGNLDEDTGQGIVELLFELGEAQGRTLVIVTHDLDLAARAHRWVHLQDGVAQTK